MGIWRRLRLVERRVWVYVALTYALTWLVDAWIVASGVSMYRAPLPVLLRMWMPGLVAIAMARRSGLRELGALGRRVPPPGSALGAYFFPVGVGALSLGLLALGGVTAVGPRADLLAKLGGLRPFVIKVLVIAPTIGMFLPGFASLGEEIGWRGYLLPAMRNLGAPARWLLNGVIWAVWHWPLILFSDYAGSTSRPLALIMFSAMIILTAVFVCWLQERSRSLWTSVIYHAAHNMWIIGIYPAFYVANARTPFLVGESGVLLVMAYALGGLLILGVRYRFRGRQGC